MQAVMATLAGRPRAIRRWRSLAAEVVADGGQRRHVQGGADAGTAAHDHAPAAEAAAVAVDRRDPDQGGDLAAIEAAELGRLGDQGAGGGLADARHRGEQVLGGAPAGVPPTAS